MSEKNIDSKALFCIGYGLYVVTCHDGIKDNGLILNSVMQVTSSPEKVAVAINKQNYSHDVILESREMNVCCLTENAPFSIFEQFGFKSGRDTDKFELTCPPRSENGLAILDDNSNAYISLRVEDYIDLGTHGLFICSVTESRLLSNENTMTYTYYQQNVKPKGKPQKKSGYVCTVCGFVYEGDDIPDDYECPVCHHGREVFEPLS